MAEVAVARLRLRARPDRAGLAGQRLTDALRLAPAGPERLLLVRRLPVGRMATSARPAAWAARAADLLAAHGRAARHALEAGPGDEAVWFRSEAEARALLLRELAAGRRPIAWFWRLAVPDWEGLALAAWLPRWLERARQDPAEEVALARAVMAVAEVGGLGAVVVAVRGSASFPASGAAGPAATAPPAAPDGVAEREATNPATPSPAAVRLAILTLARLPAAARAAIVEAVAAAHIDVAASAWIAQMAVLATTPEAGAAPAMLADAAEAVVLEARREAAAGPSPGGPGVRAPAERSHAATPAAPLARPGPPPRASKPAGVPGKAEAPPAPALLRGAAPTQAAHSAEGTSRIAGLFLTIGPLVRMGLPAWLEARPAVAAGGFGRGLLRTIGRRMRAPSGDAALAAIAGDDDPAWDDDLAAWRVGLDRWLRRTCRARLADVVRRPGGLLFAAESLDVRFAPSAADVRLRRRALDLDPHWVPWLGLAVRYHYRDEPLQ